MVLFHPGNTAFVSPLLYGVCLSPSWRMKGWLGPRKFLHGRGHPCTPTPTPAQQSTDETQPARANLQLLCSVGTAEGGGWVTASLKRSRLFQINIAHLIEGFYCESQHSLITEFQWGNGSLKSAFMFFNRVSICLFRLCLTCPSVRSPLTRAWAPPPCWRRSVPCKVDIQEVLPLYPV